MTEVDHHLPTPQQHDHGVRSSTCQVCNEPLALVPTTRSLWEWRHTSSDQDEE